MEDTGKLTLNTLNHDASGQFLDFSFRGSHGSEPVSLSGRVPLVMPASGEARQIAKDAVRQLLQEALEAL
ncbi:hypothetical protein FY036_01840 [Mesorhizobium microcysteis]|uniref:Uncharacterized protein n=1 Tax=Neoaquamicrobium microcysteis TaxID=2682781 RepID=A0A5D4H4V7_9HYPH|nr:hypothetical protein [Mesorhizobium microcysteis]TYR35637.1 hypothetical protein FY036_01840 [Mesorhizobium microcysteis]